MDGNDTVTTPPFDTAAPGELLVAFVASDGSRLSSQQLIVTGAGLTWTLKQRTNEQLGTSEIWTATAPSLLTNVQVTSTQLTGGFDQSLTVVAFAGAGGTGAVGTGNGPTGAPSLVMTTTRAGSLVYGVGNDWDSGTPRNVGTAQVMVHEWVDTAVGDTFWVQARSAPVASAGTAVAINDTLPNTDRWNLSAIEILAGGAGQVAVPSVVGLTQSAATAAITGAGLVVGSVSSSTSTTVPAGSVISQSPLGGSQAAPGSSVALIISSGPPPIAVPDVVGLTQAAASSAITSAGLAVGTIATASSATVPAGSVISQNPGAGTLVLSGSAVALTVSSGPSAGRGAERRRADAGGCDVGDLGGGPDDRIRQHRVEQHRSVGIGHQPDADRGHAGGERNRGLAAGVERTGAGGGTERRRSDADRGEQRDHRRRTEPRRR